ncbi:DUF2807 domain-containing protein [uncultured Algibacter sp.]|uniref:GIN domain-containing protein n=1 Tax=uncultured Algibacter sp. TaxID=298659 RepID=UPI00260E8134|nr:DUF2807 domain-containing protein [uncultured Algibacter sp.]
MKTSSYYLIFTLFSLVLSSCYTDKIRVSPGDTITLREVPVENYNSIEIGNGFNAFITFSEDSESIQVEGNSNLQDLIIAQIRDNKLTVKLKNRVNVKGNPTLNVYLSAKAIENFKATADSNITLENTLVANKAYISLSADSYFTGELDVKDLELRASADVRADLYGHIDYLNANLSADVRLSDYDLVVNDLKLKMVADCGANLTVKNSIYIDAKADCILKYKGNASIVYQDLKADARLVKMD